MHGILVYGLRVRPAHRGDIPYARAGETEHSVFAFLRSTRYVLGIDDLRWASDPWAGMILAKDSARPAEIAIKVYPATPLTVRVTRGPEHEPVADAWVDLSSRGEVKWTDGRARRRTGTAGAAGG